MKKVIVESVCLMMFFISVLLIGCDNKESDKITVSDICIFRQLNNGTPVKTVLSIGSTSTVCIDPLCMHDTECPLYQRANESDIGTITVGNIYPFVYGSLSLNQNTGDHSGEVQLCTYDMTNGEVRVLETYNDTVLIMYGYDRYIYYTVAVYSETDDEIKNSYMLYRADIENGNIVEIPLDSEYSTSNSISTADFPAIYTIDNNLIYWYSPGEDGYIYYTTDLAGKNRHYLPIENSRLMNGKYHDGWAYYTINKSSGSYADCKTDLERLKFLNEKILRRCNMETGVDELVAENIAEYIVTDDGIFYTVYESKPQDMEYNGDTYYDIFAGKLYRMSLDGSNAELFCVLDNVDLSVDTKLFLGYTNGKLALAFMDEMQNVFYESGYDYTVSDDVIIVDVTDRSWIVSKYEP